MTDSSTSGASGLPRAWTLRISSRPFDVRIVDDDLPVEPAGTHQGRIQDIRAVGRGDHDDALVRAEAVHLDEQLVEGLLPFVMPAAEARAALIWPTASISSMKMMQESSFSPGRTNPDTERRRRRTSPQNQSPKSRRTAPLPPPATARASRVLPVPGGPTSSTPLGTRAPSSLNFW